MKQKQATIPMKYFLTCLTFIQMFVMTTCLPVVTSVNIIPQHDTDYLHPVDTVLIGQDQDQAEEKAILESQFLGKILPPFLLRQEYKPQDMHKASKRGGKMLNKRTR